MSDTNYDSPQRPYFRVCLVITQYAAAAGIAVGSLLLVALGMLATSGVAWCIAEVWKDIARW